MVRSGQLDAEAEYIHVTWIPYAVEGRSADRVDYADRERGPGGKNDTTESCQHDS
jgi:hypothetical protein